MAKEVKITGNPGTGNIFNDTQVQKGGQYNNYPAATNVNNITRQGVLYPSLITEIINKLAAVKTVIGFDDDINVDVIYIKNKIEYNQLKRWAEDITIFTPNSPDVSRIYQEFDKAGTSKTMRVLFTLKKAFCRLSDKYRGDELFDKLLEYVMEVVGSDMTLSPGIYREDVEYNARIVLVDAFIKCEIFDKPE